MTTVVKVKSTTILESQCGCGHVIRYKGYKRYLSPANGYQGYATKPELAENGYWYKISRFSTWRLDNHYYKCEEAQNES